MGSKETWAWTNIDQCGIYQFKGILYTDKAEVGELIIHDKTQSEIKLKVEFQVGIYRRVFNKMPVRGEVEILTSLDGSHGIGKIIKIEPRVPNKLDPQDTQIKILEPKPCRGP